MKYGIDIGHNLAEDTGAVSIRSEDELIMEVGLKVIDKLRALGHRVINCIPSEASSLDDSLYQRTQAANKNEVDFFVSIHFNAGGGRGTEVYAISETARTAAGRVAREIETMGFANRGVKDGSWVYVIRSTVMPAILVKCAFVDSEEDMQRYNGEDMADAIVRGLTGSQSDNKSQTRYSRHVESHTGDKLSEGEIFRLQKALNKLKIRDYSGNEVAEDGILGPRTASALENFQSLVGMWGSGLPDASIWDSINSILDKQSLKLNSTQNIPVKYIQWRTGTYIDGYYGPLTKESVMNYQKQNGLIPDGIVGMKTWGKLIG